ncbi:hypothetical protein [Methanolobus sp.]|uniref:hypothetical protein n=1 Tax=Methanolobus sp. TaxID=1874737 RepID=UPI002600DD4A|nr:hypothetical protein [Methanolobus sp.]
MSQSANKSSGVFVHALQSIPDYSEVLVMLLILALMSMSSDEIADFLSLVREAFIYPGFP